TLDLERLRANPSPTLADPAKLLTPSLAVREQGGLGQLALMRYRGLPSEYVIVYRDGVRITNEQNSLTDLGWLDPAGVSSMELIPAITSITLGGEAIGAAINIASFPVVRESYAEIRSSIGS